MRDAWDPNRAADYRAEFLSVDGKEALRRILTGMGSLSGGELGARRSPTADQRGAAAPAEKGEAVMTTRMLALIGAVVFIAVGIGWRSWYQYRHFGSWGWRLFRSGHGGQHLRDSGLVVLCALVLVQAAARACDAAWLKRLELTPPSDGVGCLLGMLLLIGGTVLMVRAQLDLGVSWRIGIDERERPGLVTRGIYRFSRNPIYVALFVMLIGFLVLIPTWLSLGVLVGAVAAVHNQARQEETYLRIMYGADFDAYARRVGRFVPGLGRLTG